MSYDWDTAGNLWDRGDLNASWQSEHFCTDGLNRLSYANFGASCGGSGRNATTYDAAGNILTRSDVGTYAYTGAGPHAVTSVTGTVNGVVNPGYSYDANGAMTSGAGRTVSYTGFNMTKVVSEGATTETLSYDTEHARSRQVTVVGGVSTNTAYLNDPAANVMTEVSRTGTGPTQWKSYILADGHIVAQRLTVTGTPSPVTRYFVLDHLGSISVVTDETGAVVTGGRQSYDAWGKERNPDGTPDTTCSLPAQSQTTRGFTSQEEMPAVCLVNFNARLYDPQLGRFMAADSVVQNPYDAQSLNRYTYVVNNPLSETDPTGNCHGMLECVGDGMVDASFPLIGIRPLLRQYPAIGSVLEIAASIACASPLCGAAVAGEVAGLTSGDVGTGFKAFAIAYAEGLAFYGVGELHIDTTTPLGLFESAGYHGFVGGLTSMAQGGRFGSGFIAAALSDLGSPDPATTDLIPGTIQSAVIGGVGSVLGGGKFADGAVTGAFGYLFNEVEHPSAKLIFQSTAGYGNPDQAANASIAMAKTLPNFDSLEYGGLIFKDANGWEFSLYKGTEGNIPISVDGKTIVAAWWHTHPSYSGMDAFVFSAGNALNSEELSRCQGCDVDVTRAIDRQLQRYQGPNVTIGAYLYSIQSKTLYNYSDPVNDFSAKREVSQ